MALSICAKGFGNECGQSLSLLDISNMPEFNLKQFGAHSYGHFIVVVGVTVKNDLNR